MLDKIYQTRRNRIKYTGQYILNKIYRTKSMGQIKLDKIQVGGQTMTGADLDRCKP